VGDGVHGHVRQDLIHALSKSSLLRFLGAHHPDMLELRRLLETAEILHVPAGRPIIHEGQEPDRMYFLISGTVHIIKGDKHIASLARMGDVFGEFGAMSGEMRSATVIAESAVICLATDRGFARRLAKEENAALMLLFHRAMGRILMDRLTQVSNTLIDTEKRLCERDKAFRALHERNKALEEEIAALRGESGTEGLDWPKRNARRPRDHR
jgi:CRP-like cAMP-binding protein